MWKRGRLTRRERREFEQLVRAFFERDPYDPEGDVDAGPARTPELEPRHTETRWWKHRPHGPRDL